MYLSILIDLHGTKNPFKNKTNTISWFQTIKGTGCFGLSDIFSSQKCKKAKNYAENVKNEWKYL